MKLIFTFSALTLGVFLSGCTPELKDYTARQWQEMKAYDYSQAVDVFGFGERFPNYAMLERQQDARMCLHGDSENRIVMMEGTNDEIYYRRCTLQQYPNHQPQRFEGR